MQSNAFQEPMYVQMWISILKCMLRYLWTLHVFVCLFVFNVAKNLTASKNNFEPIWWWSIQEKLVTPYSSKLRHFFVRMSFSYVYRSKTNSSFPPIPLNNLSFVWTQCQVSIAPRHCEGKDIVPSGFAGLLRRNHWSVCCRRAAQIFILITQAISCTQWTRQVTTKISA